jgi:hypothetical protein
MKNKVRVPQVFQVFSRVSNYLLLNMNILLYSIHGNIVKEVIYIILEIYLSKKVDPDLTLIEIKFSLANNM